MLVVAIICAVVVLLLIILYFVYNNREVALRKEAEAQRGKIESVYDTMWKVLKQEAGVTEQYRQTFEKIYPALIAGRYSGNGGELVKMIQESNPAFDTKLYDKLMQAIGADGTNAWTSSLPSKWFISNKSKIDYTVISSEKTQSVMTTRREDDVDLFS